MPLPRPSSFPEWTVGNPNFGTVTTEPTSQEKENGWSPNQRPPREIMNWLFFNLDEWAKYLDSVATEVLAQNTEYVAVIGTGGTHASFADLIADSNITSGKVLVNTNQTITAPIVIDGRNDLVFEILPGVVIQSDGSVIRGFDILNSNRIQFLGGRFIGFNNAGDRVIRIQATSKNTALFRSYFFDNDGDVIEDLGQNTTLDVINEVA